MILVRGAMGQESRSDVAAYCHGDGTLCACGPVPLGADPAAAPGQRAAAAALIGMSLFAKYSACARTCAGCGRYGTVDLKRCDRCKAVWYCGRNCQIQHWDVHKPNCSAQDSPVLAAAVSLSAGWQSLGADWRAPCAAAAPGF